MQKNKFVTPEVNLLPEDDLEQKSGGKFLKWSLSWGKKIVILTELLVVMAFLSRFKLDSDVANYSEEIDRRKTIIMASEDFEKQFRSVQARISKVNKLNSLPEAVTIYSSVNSLIPGGVAVEQTTITGTQVKIEGTGEDKDLSSMIQSFKSSPHFKGIILDKVTKKGENLGIDFSMQATYIEKK